MRSESRFSRARLLLGVGLGVLLSLGGGCFHSDGDRRLSGIRTLDINTGNKGRNLAMNMGETWEYIAEVDVDISDHGGPYTGLDLDLSAHLPSIAVTLAGQAQVAQLRTQAMPAAETAVTAQMYLRVAPGEAVETVCQQGELYGPFVYTLDVNHQPTTVDPPTVTATETTLDVINTGRYAVCIQVLPPVDALVDLELLRLSIEGCDETPANIAGTWAGSYACTDNCGNEAGDVSLTITQSPGDPTHASYTDGSASYQGVVCGNRFTFKGGTSTYDESGTFVLNPDGSANKTSTYRSHPPSICGGTCADTLARTQ